MGRALMGRLQEEWVPTLLECKSMGALLLPLPKSDGRSGTGPRVAHMIRQEFGVAINPKYITVWLRRRGFTPQKPRRVSRERDPEAIAAWLASDWPRIKQKARRQHARIALIDESGLLMAPLVRRTWAPRGQTPDFVQRGGGGPRQKVSVAAALWLSPRRDQLGLYSKTLVNGYFDNWYVTAFLEAMMHDLDGRFVVVWDGGPMTRVTRSTDSPTTSLTACVWRRCRPGRRGSTRPSRCGVG